jgi:uncharacterized protein (TIGR02271 family)
VPRHDALGAALRTDKEHTMATTLDSSTLQSLRGNNIVDRNGDKIGSFSELYFDNETGAPEWAAVKTGLFGTNVNLVPLQGADRHGDDLQVAYDADLVKSAPDVDADQELSVQDEQRLYSHYGFDYGGYGDETRDRSGEPPYGGDIDYQDNTVARDTSGPETDSAMTRSEEELRVGTSRRERGRVRLRKYVETDTVTKTVPVEREVARVETEPITDANIDDAMDGPALSEDEAEVTLSEEEVVVDKRTVPKERVRLETDVVSDERQVSEDVGRERIEVDGDPDSRRRR